jgi:DNA modification methylase
VAAVNLNRKFIGIEQDDKYFAIAQKRIVDAQTPKELWS